MKGECIFFVLLNLLFNQYKVDRQNPSAIDHRYVLEKDVCKRDVSDRFLVKKITMSVNTDVEN